VVTSPEPSLYHTRVQLLKPLLRSFSIEQESCLKPTATSRLLALTGQLLSFFHSCPS
jgi:hypothetical protein